MKNKIGLFVLDLTLAILLGFGIIGFLLPLVLHLWLGADNDAYIEIAEWGGGKVYTLAHWNMVWMFQVEYFLLFAGFIFVGVLLKWQLWRSSGLMKFKDGQ